MKRYASTTQNTTAYEQSLHWEIVSHTLASLQTDCLVPQVRLVKQHKASAKLANQLLDIGFDSEVLVSSECMHHPSLSSIGDIAVVTSDLTTIMVGEVNQHMQVYGDCVSIVDCFHIMHC